MIRKVEVEVEAALDKLRGAAKDLNKGLRELAKMLADDQKELTKYLPGVLGPLLLHGSFARAGKGREACGVLDVAANGSQQGTYCMYAWASTTPLSQWHQTPCGQMAACLKQAAGAFACACVAVHTEGSGPYVVPDEAGTSQDAFYNVTMLEEALRVMSPDLAAIQVRGSGSCVARPWAMRALIHGCCGGGRNARKPAVQRGVAVCPSSSRSAHTHIGRVCDMLAGISRQGV